MITVWRIPLSPSAPPTAQRVALLTDTERARAARFRFDEHRHRWLHAHVAMRLILSEELGVEPGEIRYEEGAKGKPRLSWPAERGVEFNLSDSGDLALFAISDEGPVGIDVEVIREVPDLDSVARSHFAPEERDALLALPAAERTAGFYLIWTRKEAYIKAIGDGLSFGLGRFAVTLPAATPRILHLDGDTAAAQRWALLNVPTEPNYVGALAIERAGATIDVRDLSH